MPSLSWLRSALLNAMLTLVVLGSSIFQVVADGKWTILQTWHPPFLYQNGLTCSGRFLYFVGAQVTGISSAKLYRFNPASGTSTEVCMIPVADTARAHYYWKLIGLTRNGEHFAVIEHYSDTAMGVEFDTTGLLHNTFPLPVNSALGLSWDAGSYWTCEEFTRTLYQQTPDGAILKQFTNTALYPSNLCVQDDIIWETEFWGDSIHRLTKNGMITGHFKPEKGHAPAITSDGTYVWYTDHSLDYGFTLYKVDPDGTGTPRLYLPASSHPYGAVPIDSTRTWSCVVHNTGEGDLVVNAIHLSSVFYCITTLPDTIPPGDSLVLPVAFIPPGEGLFNGTLTLETSDPFIPTSTIQLDGSGVFNGARIKALEPSLEFGSRRTGSCNRKTIHLVNVGSMPLTVSSITCPGTGFIISDPGICPVILQTNDTLSVYFWFFPEYQGYYTGVVSIVSADTAHSPLNITLSGSAKDSVYAPGSLLWSVAINQLRLDSASRLISVLPIGDVNGDQHEDLILHFENGVTCCINGNADPEAELLWRYDRWYQTWGATAREPAILADINGDGIQDVVCAYFNKIVALSGKTGQELWAVSVQGVVSQVDARFDFNGDSLADVLAASQYTQVPPFAEGEVTCLGSTTGGIIWSRHLSFPAGKCIGVDDFTHDGTADVVAGSDYPFSDLVGISGANGSDQWVNYNLDIGAISALKQTEDKDGDGIRDFIAGSHAGRMNYCSAVSGTVLCSNRAATYNIEGFVIAGEPTGNGAGVVFPFGPTTFGSAYSGKNCLEKAWADSLPGESAVASNAGDLNGDHLPDLFTGGDRALFVDGKSGSLLGYRLLPSRATAMNSINDLTGDTTREMVVGGQTYLYCLSSHLKKWGAGIILPGELDQSFKGLTLKPNPASKTTSAGFYLNIPSKVTIAIYTLTGIKTRGETYDGLPGAGAHRVTLNTSGLRPGIYVVRVTAESEMWCGKLVVAE